MCSLSSSTDGDIALHYRKIGPFASLFKSFFRIFSIIITNDRKCT